jgi:hypothetical protein
MGSVSRKTEIEPLDGSPEKRMYWSIINDYNNQTAITELIDNAIDLFLSNPQRTALVVEVDIDVARQSITITDNAGGVSRGDLRYLIAPGASKNLVDSETIGLFGVGGKRAVIALGEHVTVQTCHGNGPSFQIDITKEWMESDDWSMPAYKIPSISQNTTRIECNKLNTEILEENIELLRLHFGETYAWFMNNENCTIRVNGVAVKPIRFNKWAYPPEYLPRRAMFTVSPDRRSDLRVEITAGLIRDRDPVAENYGVYFYCNNRLIAKEMRSRDVGYYVSAEAGVPHPDASLCRAIVRFNGPAKLMPWNSNKTAIQFTHPAFLRIRGTLLQLVSHFSKLSRATKSDWPKAVFAYSRGKIIEIEATDIEHGGRLNLPALPRVRKKHSERLKEDNEAIIRDQPWTLGLVEAVAAVEIISRQRLETKNRLALIVLDSNFEIALKEFVTHRKDLWPNPDLKTIFRTREIGVNAVSAKISIPQKLLDKAAHYYQLRNKLIHERATVDITDTDVENYQDTVERILNILFGLTFG